MIRWKIRNWKKIILLTGYSTEDNDKKAENIEKPGNSLKSNEWRIR